MAPEARGPAQILLRRSTNTIAGGTSGHGIGRLSNEVTVVFATRRYFYRFAPNRYATISTTSPFCAWSNRLGAQVGLAATQNARVLEPTTYRQ